MLVQLRLAQSQVRTVPSCKQGSPESGQLGRVQSPGMFVKARSHGTAPAPAQRCRVMLMQLRLAQPQMCTVQNFRQCVGHEELTMCIDVGGMVLP
jgi:hypothetical protein